MRAFAQAGGFDPSRLQATLTVAANDLQRDLLLPALLRRLQRRLQRRAPGVDLRVMPSGEPDAALLRESHCQVLITPRPPDASDLVQKRLFEDRYAVYFDPDQPAAPADLADYLASGHVTVSYGPGRPLALDQQLARQGVARRFVAQVPGFAGVAAFLRGSPRLATLPRLLGLHSLQGLASAAPPLPCPPCRCTWCGTCATRTTRCTSGCASRSRPWCPSCCRRAGRRPDQAANCSVSTSDWLCAL